ncbi:endo-1,4-beta-xylanase, partial [Bacillus tamaricis]
GWEPLSWAPTAEVETTDETASTGNQSLKFFNRSERGSSLALNLTNKLDKGETYTLSFDVKMSEGTDTLRLASKYAYPGTTNENPWLIGNKEVGSDAWTTFELENFEYHEDTTEFIIYIESHESGSAPDFFIDNFKVIQHGVVVTPGTPEEPFTPIEIAHFDFEESAQGFVARGDDVNVGRTDEAASSGEYSLKVTNRTANWHGAAVNVTDLLQKNAVYSITADVKVIDDIPEGEEETLVATMLTNIAGEETYPRVGEVSATDNDWHSIEGTFTYDFDPTSLTLYFEAATTTLSYYVDNIVITMTAPAPGTDGPPRPPAEVMETITFEDGDLNGFTGRHGDEVLTISEGVNHTEGGNYSLLVENRQQNWHGPKLDVIDYVDQGSEYEISVWVKMHEPSSAQLTLSTQVGDGDGASYNNITSATVTSSEWVELKGKYRYSSLGGGNLSIYVESSNVNASYYIDDISFVKTDAGAIEVQDLTPIKDVYEGDFLIGNAVSMAEFDGVRLELLEKHHNLVTAENAMKPSYMYGADGEFNFDAANSLVERASEEGFKVHGHVLVWHSQSYAGLYYDGNGNPLPDEVARENMYTHIEETMGNFAQNQEFRDAIISWDVVNEAIVPRQGVPLDDWKAHIRTAQNGWYDTLGADYVELAFKKAKEVKEELGLDVTLFYNDYNDDDHNKSTIIYHMIKDINERYQEEHNTEDLLIEGMGMQAHYNLGTNPANVRESMERFINLGLEIGVTELDVTAGDDGVQTAAQANRQAYIYAKLFELYKEKSEHISRVTFWGLNDSTSWRASQSPLLFDSNLQAKLAYEAVIDPEGFLENYEDIGDLVRQGEGVYTETAPILNGEIDAVWANAPRLSINRFQQAWSTATGMARVLWDEENLYVLFEVNDSELDKGNADAWEQDSVEVFLDQTNGKAPNYAAYPGVGQYRVNFENDQSTGAGDPSVYEGFESAAKVNGTSYVVEMKIPLTEISPENGKKIGFDAQVNDAADNARVGIAAWNDTTGQGYQDPSVFGVLTLTGKPDSKEPGKDKKDKNDKDTPKPKPVVTKPVVKENQATIKDKDVKKVEKDGELVVDLSKNDSSMKVSFTKEQIKTLKEQNATVTVQMKDVEISIPASVFTNGNEAVNIYLQKMNDIEGALSAVYDFKIYQGGKLINKFDSPVTLTFKVDTSKVKNPDLVKVFYWNPDTETWELVGGEYKDGFISVDVDHFSTFTVFELESADDTTVDKEKPTVDEKHKLPVTATNSYTLLLIGLLTLLAGAFFLIIVSRREKQSGIEV